MDSDGQTCNIGYQDYPTVALRRIGFTLPFQDEPEHQSRQETGKGIDLGFDSRIPEGIAECVGQCSHHTTRFNADDLGSRQLII